MKDVMRIETKSLNQSQINTINMLKHAGNGLWEMIDTMPDNPDGACPRCAALAKTKLEEAIMWAVKAVTE